MDNLFKLNVDSASELIKPTHKKKKSIKTLVDKDQITSKDIIYSLSLRYTSHKYLINNAYIFNWESDFFSISESGYLYEVEIKVTKSDFRDDFNKTDKHILLESKDTKTFLDKPNKFFYAAPKGVLNSFIIPEYAGFIEVDKKGNMATVVKEAPFLHKEHMFEKYKQILLDKFYWRYRDLLYKDLYKFDELIESDKK